MIRHWRRWTLFFFISLSLLSAHLFIAQFNQPMNTSANQSVTLRLDKNATANAFAHELYVRHLITFPKLFSLWIRAHGWSSQLKAGIYVIKPMETARQFLTRVVHGDVLVLPLRINEGVTQATLSSQVQTLPYLQYRPEDWNAIRGSHVSAEGLLLADTYHYDAGTTVSNVFLRAHQALTQFLQTTWAQRDPTLPYTSNYELLIAASIIEKEAANAEERRLISGVIVNRLKKRMPLQMDPTVIYGLGSNFSGKLTHQLLQTDSPYNTYKRYGLPPTPIAMVGKEAILAAAHPTPTNYLYFVARGDGSHQFSNTYIEQKRAINEYMHRK